MAIAFQCSCGKKYSVKDELAGKKAKCQACGNDMTVPAAAASVLETDPLLSDPLGSDPLSAPLGDLSLDALGSDPLAGALAGPALTAAPVAGGLQPAMQAAPASSGGSGNFPLILMIVGGVAGVVVLGLVIAIVVGMSSSKPNATAVAANAEAASATPESPVQSATPAATAAAVPAPAAVAAATAPAAAPAVDPNLPPPPEGEIEALEQKLSLENLLKKLPTLKPRGGPGGAGAAAVAGDPMMMGSSQLVLADDAGDLVVTRSGGGGGGGAGMDPAMMMAADPAAADPAAAASPGSGSAAAALPMIAPTESVTVAWKSEHLRGSFTGMHRAGQWQLAHPNGKSRVRGTYAADKRHGHFVVFDDQGRWTWEGTFLLGKLVRSETNQGASESGDVVLFPTSGEVRLIATSPNGAYVATVASERGNKTSTAPDEVKLWSVENWSELATVPVTGQVDALQFAPDSAGLLTFESPVRASSGGAMADAGMDAAMAGGMESGPAAGPSLARLWKATSGERLCEFKPDRSGAGGKSPFPQTMPYAVVLSPQGKYLAAIVRDPNVKVKVWDAHSGQELYTLPESEPVKSGGQTALQHSAVAFSPDELQLATLTSAGLRLWNAEKGTATEAIPNAPAVQNYNSGMSDVSPEAMPADAGMMMEGNSSGASQPPILRYAADGNTILSLEASGMRRWDLAAKSVVRIGDRKPGAKNMLADASPTGALVLQQRDADISLYDAATDELLVRLDGVLKVEGEVKPSWSVSPDWKFLLVTAPRGRNKDETVVISLPSGEEIKPLLAARDFEFSPTVPLVAAIDAKDSRLIRLSHVLYQGEVTRKVAEQSIPGLELPKEDAPADGSAVPAAGAASPAAPPTDAQLSAALAKELAEQSLGVAFSQDGRWLIGTIGGKVTFREVSKITDEASKPVEGNQPPTLAAAGEPRRLLAGTMADFEFQGKDADSDRLLYAYRTSAESPWQLDGNGKCRIKLPLAEAMTLEVMVSDGRGGRSPIVKQELALGKNIWAEWQPLWTATRTTETFQSIQYAIRQRPVPSELQTEPAYGNLAFSTDGRNLIGYGVAQGGNAGSSFGAEGGADAAVGFVDGGAGGGGGAGGSLAHVWVFSTKPKATVFSTGPSIAGRGTFAPRGDVFIAGTSQGGMLTFDIDSANFRALEPDEQDSKPALCAAASPIHTLVATSHSGPTVKIWKLSENKLQETITPQAPDLVWLDFSPSGDLLAGANGEAAVIWKTDDWTELKRIDIPACRRVFFDLTGKRIIALQDKQKRVSVWDIEAGTELVSFGAAEGEPGIWQAMAVSPDNAAVAVANESSILLYRPADGQLLRRLDGHKSRVSDVVFRPDGLALASCSADSTVHLWCTAEEGEKLAPAEKFELPKPPMRRGPRK